MRLSAASAFLQSRIGRRLFAAFFVLVAVPVAAVSLLAYQLTDYIVRQSAVQLSSEMTKAVALNLIEPAARLRANSSGQPTAGGAERAIGTRVRQRFVGAWSAGGFTA